MVLSGVSLGALAVGARRALLPIGVDVITHLVLNRLRKVTSPRDFLLRYAFAVLPAMAAVYGMYGVSELNASTLVMGCLYLAYKALVLFLFYFLSRNKA